MTISDFALNNEKFIQSRDPTASRRFRDHARKKKMKIISVKIIDKVYFCGLYTVCINNILMHFGMRIRLVF